MELIDLRGRADAFENEVMAGLRLLRKKTPPKYLYDERGSKLFERICELEEYYPYRVELELLEACGLEVADRLGPDCVLLEFGSGASVKTCLLLDRMVEPRAYAPIDISGASLLEAAKRIKAAYPALEVKPICCDFMGELRLPDGIFEGTRRRVGFFPGSTIGNLEPEETMSFLRCTAKMLGPGGALVVSVDLLKERSVLELAYNDRRGVTAQFNLNLLDRINRQLGGNFKLDRFRHHAVLNTAKGRIEMHLVSLDEQEVRIGGSKIKFRQGESVHTESSYKYEPEAFERLAAASGFETAACWSHPECRYRLYCLEAP